MEICKLCGLLSKLSKSHIIPNSFIRKVKSKSGGKTLFSTGNQSKVISNFDPKEKLLCSSCEHLLNTNYEKDGINVFRDKHSVIKNRDHIVFKNINYEKFYLFLLSIFWRASISSIDFYKNIYLPESLNNQMRQCLQKNTLKPLDGGKVRIDQLVKISLFRLKDKTGKCPQIILDKTLSEPMVQIDNTINGIIWFICIHGFLVVYSIPIGKDAHEYRFKKLKSQLTDLNIQRFEVLDINSISVLRDAFSMMNPESIGLKIKN